THTSFSFLAPPPPKLHTLSLHDALPIFFAGPVGSRKCHKIPPAIATPPTAKRTMLTFSIARPSFWSGWASPALGQTFFGSGQSRSEEHTSELQSRENLVCRLLLEKKKEQ